MKLDEGSGDERGSSLARLDVQPPSGEKVIARGAIGSQLERHLPKISSGTGRVGVDDLTPHKAPGNASMQRLDTFAGSSGASPLGYMAGSSVKSRAVQEWAAQGDGPGGRGSLPLRLHQINRMHDEESRSILNSTINRGGSIDERVSILDGVAPELGGESLHASSYLDALMQYNTMDHVLSGGSIATYDTRANEALNGEHQDNMLHQRQSAIAAAVARYRPRHRRVYVDEILKALKAANIRQVRELPGNPALLVTK